MTIKEISYEDERLGFFADQRRVVQRRYDRLEKQIKPDEPYTSERREFLSDCGRELSFYNDVIEMLENGVVSKTKINEIFKEIEWLLAVYSYTDEYGKEVIGVDVEDCIADLKKKYEKL